MGQNDYRPAEYWNAVAVAIQQRHGKNIVAGDDDPYYLYKRKKFLRLLHELPLQNRNVLEIGCGPGGNLVEVMQHNPKKLYAVDISDKMIAIAKQSTAGKADIVKTNGADLPFEDRQFDLTFSSTVLQHITGEDILEKLVGEICRVSSKDVYIFERIEKKKKMSVSNVGRTIPEYERLFAANGFVLEEKKFLHLHWSRLACGGIRKVFNNKNRREGEKGSAIAAVLEKLSLLVTKPLDKIFPVNSDTAMMHFARKN
jgi:SAM-dependent methyltransferase